MKRLCVCDYGVPDGNNIRIFVSGMVYEIDEIVPGKDVRVGDIWVPEHIFDIHHTIKELSHL